VQAHQHFAHLCLPGRHGALDIRRLEQRGIGVNRDLDLAPGGSLNLLAELDEVLCKIIVGRIGGGQVPLGLRLRNSRRHGENGADGQTR
jgi:hypothetical protein